jgi:N-acetylmuramoyl-L-alanine amidase
MHYTAATTAASATDWFLRPIAQASAHLLIDKDGAITQFAPFNIITWHAGTSIWHGLIGMNKYSIGIELVNAGRLSKSGEIKNMLKAKMYLWHLIKMKIKNLPGMNIQQPNWK